MYVDNRTVGYTSSYQESCTPARWR